LKAGASVTAAAPFPQLQYYIFIILFKFIEFSRRQTFCGHKLRRAQLFCPTKNEFIKKKHKNINNQKWTSV